MSGAAAYRNSRPAGHRHERVRQHLATRPLRLGGEAVTVTFSAGYVEFTGGIEGIEQLYEAADRGLCRQGRRPQPQRCRYLEWKQILRQQRSHVGAARRAAMGRPETFSHLRVSVPHVGDRPQVNRKQCGESIRLSASIVLRLRAFRLIPTIDLMLRRM